MLNKQLIYNLYDKGYITFETLSVLLFDGLEGDSITDFDWYWQCERLTFNTEAIIYLF